MDAAADHISNMVSKHSLSSAEETSVFDADFFPSAEGLSPEPFGKYCPQSKLEPILLAETRRRGPRRRDPPDAPQDREFPHRQVILVVATREVLHSGGNAECVDDPRCTGGRTLRSREPAVLGRATSSKP